MGWKLRGRLAGLLLLSVSFVNANAGYSIGPAQAGVGDPVATFNSRENRMDAAQAEARRHFEQFFAFILEDQEATRIEAGVKVEVPVSNGARKVAWVRPFAGRDGQFSGLVTGEPDTIKNYNTGDVIYFSKAQVRDWYFHGPNGKMYGSFMTRAMLDELPANSTAQISLLLADTPAPANW